LCSLPVIGMTRFRRPALAAVLHLACILALLAIQRYSFLQ
jgi:hypothetical protein